MTVDYSLYLVIGTENIGERPLEPLLRQAAAGGVSIVQLREKSLNSRDFLETACRVHEVLKTMGIPLIINDRADIALACGAEGLHIGQGDLPPAEARKLMGPSAVIGLSVESPEDATAAGVEYVDYLGISPVFSTPTKTDTAAALGLDGVGAIRALSELPLVGIGGISEINAGDVVAAGADGVAVVSAICSAEDPAAASGRLREIIDKHRNMK